MQCNIAKGADRRQNIQILRVLACIGVFMTHVGQRANLQGWIRKITDFGAEGVYLFFIISGLVCFWSLEKDNFSCTGKRYISYLVKRAFRILPLYYSIIIIEFCVHFFVWADIPGDSSGLYWNKYIFLLSRVVPSDNNFWNNLGATWTISVFMMFYLLAPFLWKVIKGIRSVLVMWGLFFLVDIILSQYTEMFEPFRMMHYFICGIGIYYAWKEMQQNEALIIISIALLIQAVFGGVFTTFSFAAIFAMIILGSENLRIQNKVIKKIIDILDDYSYTVYLCHAIVIEIIDKMEFNKSNPYLWRLEVLGIAVVGTVVASWIMKTVVERPAQKIWVKIKHD